MCCRSNFAAVAIGADLFLWGNELDLDLCMYRVVSSCIRSFSIHISRCCLQDIHGTLSPNAKDTFGHFWKHALDFKKLSTCIHVNIIWHPFVFGYSTIYQFTMQNDLKISVDRF